MSIIKPYPRVYLPMKNSGINDNEYQYCYDSRYIDDMEATSLVNSARIIISDYKELTDYVEPVDNNKAVYSHRTYELLLRIAIEFEANCKGILKANGSSCRIKDFRKLNTLMKLDNYEITSTLWHTCNNVRPFEAWATGQPLQWFEDYKECKHNRFQYFSRATMRNVFDGISCLVVLLAAQFPNKVAFISGNGMSMISESEGRKEEIMDCFTIRYPSYSENEHYEFDWNILSRQSSPFDKYNFEN